MTTRNELWNWTAWHRSCISARRALRARKAFSRVLMRTAGDGPRWSHKSQNEAIRTCPAANMSERARPSVKPRSAVSAPDTYVYLHRQNKLPYVQGVATLPVAYFNERYWSEKGDRCITATKWWTLRTFTMDRKLESYLGEPKFKGINNR